GGSNVMATDIRETDSEVETAGPLETLDVTDGQKLNGIAKGDEVDTIIHLAAILSATAVKNRLFAWNLSMGGLVNALEA
ncbi:UDP-glucose 4-epimerase, partial [Bacillus thuringiensis]|nr:UDP-glucose 4-epimerase [Bacillus thuringiensis]